MLRAPIQFLAIALITITATAAYAAPTVEEILGPWNLKVNAMGQEINMRIVLRQENGELTGTIDTPQGSQEAEQVKYEGDQLSWIIKFGPQPLQLFATVVGETFSGKSTTPFGEIEFSGTKVSADAIASELAKFDTIVGDWTVQSQYGGETIESSMRFQIAENELRGSVDAPGVDARVGRIELEGDQLSWVIALPFVSDRPARARVTLDGEGKFAGTLQTSLGDVPINGELIDTLKLSISPYDDPAAIIGDWQVTADINGQPAEAKVTIFEKDDRLAATIVTPDQELHASEVNWEKVGDTMGVIQLHVLDSTISPEPLHFEITVDGATFEGEEISGKLAYPFIVTGKKL